MKNLTLAVFAASMLLAAHTGHAAKCKFEKGLPVTTEWDGITSSMTNPLTTGSVAAVFDGDRQKVLLGVQVKTTDYYRPPEWYESKLKKDDKDQYKALLKEHVAGLRNDSVVIPAGSELRITFTDRTTLTLVASQETRPQGQVTKPGEKFKEKGFGGMMKSAAAAGLGGSAEKNLNFRVDAKANVFYELTPDDLDLLTRSPVMNIRVEARDNYYYLGTRDTDHNLAFSEKASLKVQDALNCVLNKK
jgi:hypothetical protein